MAELQLTHNQRLTLIRYLGLYGRVETTLERRAFYENTGLSNFASDLLRTIPIEGATEGFCESLIFALQKHGTIPTLQQPSLVLVLEYLRATASGQEDVVLFVNEILATLGFNRDYDQIYEHACDYFYAERWQEALYLFDILEAHQYNPDIGQSVLVMKQQAIAEVRKIDRSNALIRDYARVVKMTQKQVYFDNAIEEWKKLLKKYPEFTDKDDTENLRQRFESTTELPDNFPSLLANLGNSISENQILLNTFTDIRCSPIERAKAGRNLSKDGDPRPEVLEIDEMQFCWVPSGKFWMGSNQKDDDLSDKVEQPDGWYDIPYGYWIARFPVTNAQFIGSDAAKMKGYTQNAYSDVFYLANHPVIGVTWYQCRVFAEKLTRLWQRRGYLSQDWIVCLPNEPEWEKAAKGGDFIIHTPTYVTSKNLYRKRAFNQIKNSLPRRRFPYGDEADSNLINFQSTKIGTTNAVGCFKAGASPYGCEEMSGNVWEWTRSRWDETYPYSFQRDNNDELSISNLTSYTIRGGAYDSVVKSLRTSFRFKSFPSDRHEYLGFRLVVIPRVLPSKISPF